MKCRENLARIIQNLSLESEKNWIASIHPVFQNIDSPEIDYFGTANSTAYGKIACTSHDRKCLPGTVCSRTDRFLEVPGAGCLSQNSHLDVFKIIRQIGKPVGVQT